MDSLEQLKDRLRTLAKVLAASVGTASALGIVRYLLFLIEYKRKQNRKELPWSPGPTPLPVVGSLLDVAKHIGQDGNPLVHIALMEMGQKYNGLFGLYLGANYTIVLTKPSVAEEAFCDHLLDNGDWGRGANCTDRAMNQSQGGSHVPTMKIATRDGQGIAMSHGSYWRKVRGRLVAHITNPKVAEKNAPMIMEEVSSVVWGWRQKALRGEPIDTLNAQLKRESMNMATRLLFSQRYGDDLPEDYKNLKFAVEYIFQNLSSGNPSDMIPALRVLPNPFLREFQKVVDDRDQILDRIIGQHRKEFQELRSQGKMTDRAQARDIADLFFFDQEDGFTSTDSNGVTTHEKMTADQVTVCIWDIIFASTDTTATTNEFAIYHLINNPDVQRKVHEELDRVVGPDRLPELADREHLPYFWAFIKEVFRFNLVSPVAAPHYAVNDMTLHDTTGQEYFVPAGTGIFLHGYSMARDPELWDEPEKFKPERWLNGRDEDLDLYGQVKRKNVEHYKFTPFSLGPRMCPGYSLAKVAQFLQAATIVHCFEFRMNADAAKNQPSSIVKDGKLNIRETWGLSISPTHFGEQGLVMAKPRQACRLSSPMYNDISTNVPRFLNGKEEKKAKLIQRQLLSADTVLLRFGLDVGNQQLGLPIGKHVKIVVPNPKGREDGKWNGRDDPEANATQITRAYTPTSLDTQDVGFIDLLVKVYEPNKNAKFLDGGKCSNYLGKLELGDEITMTGPWGLIEYKGRSEFKIGRNLHHKKYVGMVAGGSGITPMLQILRASLEDKHDTTKYSLIYANQTEADILCRDMLEDLKKRFPSRFRLHYTVDRVDPEQKWEYSVGFVDEEMVSTHMPPKSSETLVLGCGPPPMMNMVKQHLEKLGYSKEHFAIF